MVESFHGSVVGFPDGFLTHFGSFDAAAQRMESVFNGQELRVFHVPTESVLVFDQTDGKFLRPEPLLDTLKRFTDFMKRVEIYQVDLDVQKPLALVDCWDDDPIGSAGLQLFAGSADLSGQQKQELATLFRPFPDILYSEEVSRRLSPRDIRLMNEAIAAVPRFQKELEKRQHKQGAKRFARDAPFEIAWTFYTMKLYDWARKEGYDALTYHSQCEGDGATPFYVTFDAAQIHKQRTLTFCADAFYAETAPVIAQRLVAMEEAAALQGSHMVMDVFLGGNPTKFWAPASRERLIETPRPRQQPRP